jgi:hypothetical protein
VDDRWCRWPLAWRFHERWWRCWRRWWGRARWGHIFGLDQKIGPQFLSYRTGWIGWRLFNWRCWRGNRIDAGTDNVLETGELLPIVRKLIKELVAERVVLGLAQQAPKLMLPLRERDETSDIVAVSAAGGGPFAFHCHPFGYRPWLLFIGPSPQILNGKIPQPESAVEASRLGSEVRQLTNRIPWRIRLGLLLVSATASIGLVLAHGAVLDPVIEGTGYSIVDFELAGDSTRAMLILDAWGAEGRSAASDAIRIDFGFLVAYGIFLTLACSTLATLLDRWPSRWIEPVGWRLAALAPVASLLDAVENTALIRVLRDYGSGSISGFATTTAEVAAVIKFSIVAIVAVYLVLGTVALIYRWLRASR